MLPLEVVCVHVLAGLAGEVALWLAVGEASLTGCLLDPAV